MPPLPTLSSVQVVKAFQKWGWQVVRQRGSHIIMTKPGQMATLSIPDYSEVAKGTLRGLIRSANLSIDQFLSTIP
jgi:predicted RNA binding protein YcfA (HicA-like mRNA interferase family)